MPSLKSKLFRYVMQGEKWLRPDHKSLLASRERFDRFGKRYPLFDGTSVETVDIDGLYSEWLIPPNANAHRAVLYLHGGGYEVGSCTSHRAIVSYLAGACQARTLLPNYRLAPEYPFPAGLEDALYAYAWLLSQGYAAKNLVVMGDSAGGGLTLATLLSLLEQGSPLPSATVLLSPWTDLAMTGASIRSRAGVEPMLRLGLVEKAARKYCGDHDPHHPLISPLYANLHGLPPMLIHVGDDEILLDDSTRLADRAQAAGGDVTAKVWPGMWHFFHWSAMHNVVESKQAIVEIAAFVGAHTAQSVGRRLDTGD
ncbi:MAG: alpha/beta hydrolase [Anaerolineae bacterium]|nr:alpha/beta hydrolase [Anaerolineae bacterium]